MTMDLHLAPHLWPSVFAISLALAAGLGSFLVLQPAADLAWRLFGRRDLSRLKAPSQIRHGQGSKHLAVYVPVVGATVAAAYLAPRSPLLGACFVALGLVLSRYVRWKRFRAQSTEVAQELEKLVTTLHSIYLVRPAVAPALEEAAQSVEGPLRQVVDQALRTIWVGGDPRDAYAGLGKAIASPYLAQLGLILERAEECDPSLVGQAMRELGLRLQRRRRLQARAKATMSMLSGTVRFLQGANAVAVGIVMATPSLVDFYLASLPRQGMFALALVAILGASLYFDHQLTSLKERAL